MIETTIAVSICMLIILIPLVFFLALSAVVVQKINKKLQDLKTKINEKRTELKSLENEVDKHTPRDG